MGRLATYLLEGDTTRLKGTFDSQLTSTKPHLEFIALKPQNTKPKLPKYCWQRLIGWLSQLLHIHMQEIVRYHSRASKKKSAAKNAPTITAEELSDK